jgi:hypothetical protein
MIYTPVFVTYALPNVILLEPTEVGQYWDYTFLSFGVNISMLKSHHWNIFSDGRIKETHSNQKNLNLKGTPQLININHTIL